MLMSLRVCAHDSDVELKISDWIAGGNGCGKNGTLLAWISSISMGLISAEAVLSVLTLFPPQEMTTILCFPRGGFENYVGSERPINTDRPLSARNWTWIRRGIPFTPAFTWSDQASRELKQTDPHSFLWGFFFNSVCISSVKFLFFELKNGRSLQ